MSTLFSQWQSPILQKYCNADSITCDHYNPMPAVISSLLVPSIKKKLVTVFPTVMSITQVKVVGVKVSPDVNSIMTCLLPGESPPPRPACTLTTVVDVAILSLFNFILPALGEQ